MRVNSEPKGCRGNKSIGTMFYIQRLGNMFSMRQCSNENEGDEHACSKVQDKVRGAAPRKVERKCHDQVIAS